LKLSLRFVELGEISFKGSGRFKFWESEFGGMSLPVDVLQRCRLHVNSLCRDPVRIGVVTRSDCPLKFGMTMRIFKEKEKQERDEIDLQYPDKSEPEWKKELEWPKFTNALFYEEVRGNILFGMRF